MGTTVLIPVDFSDMSLLACKFGFDFAKRLGAVPHILHSYVVPLSFPEDSSYFDSLPYDGFLLDEELEVTSAEQLKTTMDSLLRKFVAKIDSMKASGELPDVDYTAEVCEGVPEECILDYTRRNEPVLVVMATRGRSKKQEQLIGSVTAEVLDSSRVPVFTVPEHCSFRQVRSISKLAFFCNVEQQDAGSMAFFMKMFDNPVCRISLVPVSGRLGSCISVMVDQLRNMYSSKYPNAYFSVVDIPEARYRHTLEDYIAANGIEMLVVPNRKTSILSRIFNPSIPHRMLFECDLPMLALPV